MSDSLSVLGIGNSQSESLSQTVTKSLSQCHMKLVGTVLQCDIWTVCNEETHLHCHVRPQEQADCSTGVGGKQ